MGRKQLEMLRTLSARPGLDFCTCSLHPLEIRSVMQV